MMMLDLNDPLLSVREREAIELLISLHEIYRSQNRRRESYTAATCAMRLWHLWTRDAQPSTMSMPLKDTR